MAVDSIVDMPPTRLWEAREFVFDPNDVRFRSSSAWSRTYQDYPVPGSWHWGGYVTIRAAKHWDRAGMEAWLDNACEAGALIRMGHPKWRAPRGTLRGAPTCYGGASKGAREMVIQTNPVVVGATLYAGDWIGFPDQLCRITKDAITDGAGRAAIEFRGPLRKDVANGAVVTWNWPKALFQAPSRPTVIHVPGYSGEFTLDLIERWL